MGLVTAETVMVFDKGHSVPAIVLIGRDENDKRLKWRTTFWPYLYLDEADYIRLKSEKLINFTKYVREFSGTETRTLDRRPLTKLFIKDSKYTTSFVHMLSKTNKVGLGNSMFSYEADLSTPGFLAARFLIDKGIRSGVDIEGSKLTPIDFAPRLRLWFIDFEALSNKRGGGGPRKEDPIPIVTYYDSYDKEFYTLMANNKVWKEGDKDGEFLPEDSGSNVSIYDNEGLLLEALANAVVEKDPDVIIAWNLDRYDIIKWVDRMKENHLDPGKLSPFNVFGWKNKPYRVKGRILFDLMRAFKRFTDAELRSYNLGAVAEEEELGIEKVQFTASTQWLWDNEPLTMFNRNLKDVKIMLALDEKYDLVDMFDDLRKEFGALFNEVLLTYRVLDTALMRMVSGKIALNTSFKGQKIVEKLLGAVVVKPVPGKYEFVAQFDFGREYPSLIRAFNIGPETYRDPEFTGDCFTIAYGGRVYKFVKNPKSLIAQLIEQFFQKRERYEMSYKIAIEKNDDILIKAWYRKIFNIKKMTNAFYGVMDFPSFRLYNPKCTQATAVLGRISIEELDKYLTCLSYKLLYGDTDSIFVPLKSRTQEEAVAEAKGLEAKINQHLSEFFIEKYGLKSLPSNMGLKKVYIAFLLLAKKNYAGKSFWDEKKGYKVEYDFKGLEVIRSDSSSFEKEVMEKVVRTVLEGDIADVQGIREESLRKLSSRTMEPLAVSYPLQISESLEKYPKMDKNGRPQMPAHVRAAVYSNMYLKASFGIGDKPRRLPIMEVKKLKVSVGQKTLFGGEDLYLPSDCTVKYKYRVNGENKMEDYTFEMKGISINEDLEVPKCLIGRIDWDRIEERLGNKIDRIMGAIKGVEYKEEVDEESSQEVL